MSYKKRKINKSKFSQLKYKVGLVKLALKRAWLKVVNIKGRRGKMRQRIVSKIMEELRTIARKVSEKNIKINEWVDEYVNRCVLNGTPVEILTQWCLAKDLTDRRQKQGGQFVPLAREREMFEKNIPEALQLFLQNKVRVNWWITFNDSYLEGSRVPEQVAIEYVQMITRLAQQNDLVRQNVVFFNWEKDILGARPQPSQAIMNNFERLVKEEAFELELAKMTRRAEAYSGVQKTREELRQDTRIKIACEAEEGRFLLSKESPINDGEFIIAPLESAERVEFFSLLSPKFFERVAAVLRPYPWRMDEGTLNRNL
jgi:hypothetical protein